MDALDIETICNSWMGVGSSAGHSSATARQLRRRPHPWTFGRGLGRSLGRTPPLHQTTAASGGHTFEMCDESSQGGHPPQGRWQQLPSRFADASFMAARPPPPGGPPPGHLSNCLSQRKTHFRILNKKPYRDKRWEGCREAPSIAPLLFPNQVPVKKPVCVL